VASQLSHRQQPAEDCAEERQPRASVTRGPEGASYHSVHSCPMAAPGADDKAVAEDGAVREQDKFLPIANISRIMKEGLPQNAKISKDAKELVQQCVSDFIIFVTSECAPTHAGISHQPRTYFPSLGRSVHHLKRKILQSKRQMPKRETKDCQWR
jgi:histone H3/H4